MTIATLERSQIITLLDIPYHSQRDNRRDPWRTCNSTSCFMAVEGIKPGLWRSDCDYIDELYNHYGDTTNHSAHTNMLWNKGIKSSFHYDLDYENLSASLKRGKAIVVGVLHKGTIFNPYGGGHMIVIIGEYEGGYIAHDPWGYPFSYRPGSSGASVLLPYESLDARWLVEGKKSGWGRIFH